MGASKTEAAENALHDQTNLLPKRQLIFVFCIMATALLVCFIDQNGIGVLLPSIARDLDARESISWAGTSALISNTVFQVLYGRLSDLFGRKKIFLSALILLSLSDLACGLSVNATMLYIFRGLAGVANGGITSLSMMIVSDVVSLRDRGKYQGILGCMVGSGNALGPLIASAFAVRVSWRGLFWFLSPTILLSFVASYLYLPTNMPKTSFRETVSKIDFLGVLFGSAAIILILIPISDGGHSGAPWTSPTILAMLIVGIACLVIFLIIEWKFATLPMMPLAMFRKPSVAAMLAQSFLLGIAYYSLIYFLPLYFQNVRGKSALISAVLVLPLVVVQSTFSTSAGFYMTYMNRYIETIWFGFGMWTLGGGLLTMADETTNFGLIALYLMFIGSGCGCTFQPTLVALQAHCPKAQRAVVVSNRNFLRCAGGAVGLATSSAILSAVLRSSLPADLASVANSAFASPDLANYDAAQRALIKAAYTDASRAVFIYLVPLTGLCFLLTGFVKDHGLVRKEEREAAAAAGSQGQGPVAVVGAEADADLEKGAMTADNPDKEVEVEHVAAEDDATASSPGSSNISRKPSVSTEKSARL